MKFLLAFAFVTIFVTINAAAVDEAPDAHKEKAKKIVEECRAEVKVSDEEFAKMKAGELENPSEEAKCLTKCYQEKAGIYKDGAFNEEVVIAQFTPALGEEKIKSIIEACRGQTGDGKCEINYKYHQCFKKNGAY